MGTNILMDNALRKKWIQLCESEGYSETDLCVYTWNSTQDKCASAFVFDKLKNVMIEAIDAGGDFIDFEEKLRDCIVAYVKIAKPVRHCNDAWEVKEIAASRRAGGKLAYHMGYWLSPTGQLISDRSAISPDAVAAWSRLNKKQSGDLLDDCDLWPVSKTAHKKKMYINPPDKLKPEEADALNRSHSVTVAFDFNTMKNQYTDFADQLDPTYFDANGFRESVKTSSEKFFEEAMK